MLPASLDPPTASTCTSCTYSEDFSNYWTANIYFKARNGTYKRVPQVRNLGLGVEAGMTIYYIRGYQQSAKVKAFPPVSYLSPLPFPYCVPGRGKEAGGTGSLTRVSSLQGFRMLVGDPTNREASKVPRGLCFRCEANMNQSPFGGAPVREPASPSSLLLLLPR